MRRASLTLRLLAGVLLAQLLLAAGLVWAGAVFTRRQLRAAFDAELHARLMGVAALVRYPEKGPGLVFDPTLLPPAEHREHAPMYEVSSGTWIVANTFPGDVKVPVDAGLFWRFHYDGVTYRGLKLTNLPVLDAEENQVGTPPRLTVLYAAPEVDIDSRAAAAGLAIGGASLALLALTLWLAAWLTRRELAPLHELAEQAAAISPYHWNFHPPQRLAATPELQPLVAALELMLARLQAAHLQQREFMADAAHHLKTPVTILKSSLQALLQRPREGMEYVAAAQTSLQDVERLEQLLQRMLRLARAERAAASPPRIELTSTCQAALERVAPLAQARGVVVAGTGLDRTVHVRAEADDLELLWLNLLENAVQHAPSGSEVHLACSVNGGHVEVAVRDQGPGIAPSEQAYIFERFRRGAGAPAGGFGLGLAIAQALVTTHGGSIGLDGGTKTGACLRVRLPVATHNNN